MPICEKPTPTNKSNRFYLLDRPIEKIMQEDFQENVEYISELPVGILCLVDKKSNKVINFQKTSNIERALLYCNTIIYPK